MDKEKSLKTERMKEQIHGYEDEVSSRVKGGFMRSKMEREANEVPVFTPTKTSQNINQNVASS